MAAAVRVQVGPALEGRAAVPDSTAVTAQLTRAARAALRHEGATDAELSITLLDDAEIAAMNHEFLRHEGPTDVISFPLFEAGEPVVGDVYIGYEQAERQAAAHGVPLAEELARLAVHGVLHVLGHDHPDGEARLESEMWHVQEQILRRVLDA